MISILLIEDDENLGKEVCSFLEACGYRMEWVKEGKAALDCLQSRQYDLYLLDLGLPDCSGLDLCKIVRERIQAPIIMLTACDSEEDVINGLAAGADDYIAKPFSLRIVHSRIETQLRRRKWDQGREVTSILTGELVIDLQHHTITRKGEILSISKIEFELCAAMVRSEGQIMPRSLLLDRIWDEREQFIEDNTLTVHVSRLRKKLGVYEEKPYIDTIKGIGYRWNFIVMGK